MKKLFNFTLLALLAGVFLLSACEDDKDDEAPVISVASPSNHGEYAPGDVISFKATFTDNEDLSQYKIDIHEAGGHTHGKRESEWDYEVANNISGKSQTVELSIEIPAEAEHGEYDFLVECTDKEGNEASHVLLEIHIEEE